MDRRNPLHGFKRGRMIGKLEEGRSLTSETEEFGINKSVVSRAWKAFQTIGTAIWKIGGGRLRKTTAVDDRYIAQQVKRSSIPVSQQAPLLSNCVLQQGDKCRGLLWRDAFTKVAY
ncbi:uncharacterized protein TNCV_2863041 [Trichonephila clavipes]|nr:uncharacterized protein TNCV_2863041 [Trichonephila clavipes]